MKVLECPITGQCRPRPEAKFLQRVLDKAGDSIFLISAGGHLCYANQAACQLLGYVQSQLFELTIFDITPGWNNAQWSELWARLKKQSAITIESQQKNKAGQLLSVEITLNLVEDNDQDYGCAIVHPISSQSQLGSNDRKQEQRFTAVAQLSQAVLNQTKLTDLFDQAIHQVRQVLDVTYALLWEYQPHNLNYVCRAGQAADICMGTTYPTAGISTHVSPCSCSSPTVHQHDLAKVPAKSWSPLFKEGIASQASIKIEYSERFFGFLEVRCQEPRSFTPQEIDFLQTISGILATAIAHTHTQASLTLLERAINACDSGIVVLDTASVEQPIRFINSSGKQRTSHTISALLAANRQQWHSPEHFPPAILELKTAMAAGQPCTVILQDGTHYGIPQWLQFTVTPVCNEQGTVTHYVGIEHNIPHPQNPQINTQDYDRYDPLTHLPNLTVLKNRLDQEFDRWQQSHHHQFAMIHLDVDHLKKINDSFGYRIGDQLLQHISGKLQQNLRPSDMVVRAQDDAFLLLLTDIKDLSEAKLIAERIREELQLPVQLGLSQPIFITASMGIAICKLEHHSADELLRDAETALHQAKALGCAQYQVFDQNLYHRNLRQLKLEHSLRHAIANKALQLHYQPILSLDGKIVGFETLTRWHHPQLGYIPPTEFISIAERTGQIHLLGQWSLEVACQQLWRWQQNFPEQDQLYVSVNVSANQLIDPQLVEHLDRLLQRYGLQGHCLKFEITESVLIENEAIANNLLQELQDRDIQIYLDDFGTGFSSLSYLHRFPVNTLKIDRSFVERVCSTDGYEIVRAIIGLARVLGMTVVAEGVETKQQLAKLQTLDCDLAQGYLFAKPIPSEDVNALLLKCDGKNSRLLV